MAISLTVNGQVFAYPETGDQSWGADATDWASAVTTGMLQKSGGLFQLLSEVDFGSDYGLKSIYYTSRSSNSASTGVLRLSASDSISFRNNANTADLELKINPSDKLQFNGVSILSGQIVDSEVSPSAAISLSKLASVTSDRVLISDNSGVISPSSVSTTTLSYLDVTSSIQTQLNSKLSLTGGTLTGALTLHADPTLSMQAATKQYVDNAIQGLKAKDAVLCATTANITLSGEQTIDGQLTSSSRVLVKNQSNPAQNGIYVSSSSTWTRTTDADSWDELVSAYVFVSKGSSQADSGWLCTVDTGGTLGTTAITFVQFSQAGVITTDGEGIKKTGTVLSLELEGTTLSKSTNGLKVSDSFVNSLNSSLATKVTNPMNQNGDLIFQNIGVPDRLPAGSVGQILTVSSSGLPVWTNASLPNPVVTSVSSTLTLTSADSNKIFLINTSAARTINLPAPSSGLIFRFKDATGQANTNNITLVRNGSEKIEGITASKILQTNWGSWTVVSDGTDWFLI